MDQTATITHPTEAAPLACDTDKWRCAVEFARSHIAETLDADGSVKTVEARLAKWFDDFAITMKAPAVAHTIAGLDDKQMDRLLELCCKATAASSGAIVEQILEAVFTKTNSARPLIEREFNRYLHEVINALDDIACTIVVLPRRQETLPRR